MTYSDALLPQQADMLALAGLEAMPEGSWPSWGQPQVQAIVSLAGDAVMFDEAGLAEISTPLMTIGGTGDLASPYQWSTERAYTFASSPKKVQIGLTDAAHMIFTGPCEAMRRFVQPISGEFCADPAWDRGQAHQLTAHFTTAFLLSELKQDVDAATALEPSAAQFSGITYQAEGY